MSRLGALAILGFLCATALPAQEADPAARVDAALRALARAGRGVEHSDVPPRVRSALEEAKRTLRELVVFAANQSSAPSLKTAKECYGTYGCVEAVKIEPAPGHPEWLVATTTLGIPFGADTSLYLLEKRGERWSIVLEKVAHDYRTIGKVQMGLEWRVTSAPGEQPVLITVDMSSAEAGTWQDLRLNVLRPGRDAAHPKVLLHSIDDFDIGEPWDLKTDGDSFSIRYHGRYGLDLVRWGRFKTKRYIIRGDSVTRVDPIADNADEFVDEWVALPWNEARRWSSPSNATTLKRWHDRLHQSRISMSSVPPVNTCESDDRVPRTEVTIRLDQRHGDSLPEQLMALVEREGEHFNLREIHPDGEWSGMQEDERVRCPRKDFVLTSAGNLELVLEDGHYTAAAPDSFDCPNGYWGTFVARVSLKGKTVETPLGEHGACDGPWPLTLADYNHDGQLDFNFGIRENSANSFYDLFTIGRDGKVSELKVRHDDGSVDSSITAETTGNSTTFKVAADGIRARSRDIGGPPDVAYWITWYRWNKRRGMFEQGATVAVAPLRK